MIDRRTMLQVTLGGLAAAGFSVRAAYADMPKLEKKDTYKVGFAQTESNNPWRLAQTKSMKDEAEKRGWQLVYTDAAGSAAKQVADVNSMIAQGVDVIFLAPREEKPLIPAVMAAKKAGIPVILLDRNVDQSLAKAGEDYVTFIGSDFVEEGQRGGRVADQGASTARPRSSSSRARSAPRRPTTARRASTTAIKDHPRHGDRRLAVRRLRPRQGPPGVPRRCCRRIPTPTAIYAHNDEMAIGAIAALEAAGKVPGKDVHRRSRSTARKDAAPGDHRRQDAGRRRVQPALRPEGLRDAWSATARARRSSPG